MTRVRMANEKVRHDYVALFQENERRNALLFQEYDPERGLNSPIERFEFSIHPSAPVLFLPLSMREIPFIEAVMQYPSLFDAVEAIYPDNHEQVMVDLLSDIMTERLTHDFEYWAITCATVQDKLTKQPIKFKLRRAQRKLLGRLERMRLAGVPIRIILVKARQWGGSTLVQLYMVWIQLFHATRWHSAIVADVEQQATNIRGMIKFMADNHPKDVFDIKLKPLDGSSKNKVMEGRDCNIGIGSMQQPDNLRSFDFAMLHMSEVGLWKKTKGKQPKDFTQSLRSTVPKVPLSLVVMESTAKGVGNFFHEEWLAAKNNTYVSEENGRYEPIFVAWFEIEMYWLKIKSYTTFIDRMTPYEWWLWDQGATFEGINWYKTHKRDENMDDWRMQSEYPSNDIEAFSSTGRRAFAPDYVKRARQNNRKPEFIGEVTADAMKGKESLENIRFEEDSKGCLKIWDFPDKSIKVRNRYVVPVDIGGRTDDADFSVIRVIDRLQLLYGGVPEAVLTWKGHLDQDLVIWKGVQIAKMYNDGLYVPETNSIKAQQEESEGDHIVTVMDEVVPVYPNVFTRSDPEKVRAGAPVRYGFHTNVKTKTDVVNTILAALRDDGYIEPDVTVCDEYDMYEIKPDGTYGAVDGQHDDEVMCTGIGLKVSNLMELPVIILPPDPDARNKQKIVSEASF